MKKSDLSPEVLAELKRLQQYAGGKVRRAINQGLLPRVCTRYLMNPDEVLPLPCADCGRKAHCYDHRDYLDPLAVDPVCEPCNYQRGLAVDTFNKHPEYWMALRSMVAQITTEASTLRKVQFSVL